jgi:hypothetical protein
MKYWIVSELFYPEEVSTGYVMTKIAEKLNENTSVGVICGPSGYQSKILNAKYKLSKEIVIKRVSIPRFNKNIFIFKLLNIFFLTLGIMFKIIANVKKTDKIVLVTNPPTILPIVSLISKIIGSEYIVIVHDVFPDNAVAGKIIKKNSFLEKTLNLFYLKAYNGAKKLIVVGEDMKELLASKVNSLIPIDIITNWADVDDVYPLKITSANYPLYYKIPSIADKIIIQFAGNIGRVQGLDKYFSILIKHRFPCIATLFIGNGAQLNQLKIIFSTNKINDVFFLPPKSRTEQNLFLNNCHIGLVTLTPGMFGLGVPSKVYNILSAGKPILFIGDSNAEITRYIKKYDVGWAFTWDEQDEIIDFLNSLSLEKESEISMKGENARIIARKLFTKEYILANYNESIISNGK